MNKHVKELLCNRGIITKFKYPLDIDKFINCNGDK